MCPLPSNKRTCNLGSHGAVTVPLVDTVTQMGFGCVYYSIVWLYPGVTRFTMWHNGFSLHCCSAFTTLRRGLMTENCNLEFHGVMRLEFWAPELCFFPHRWACIVAYIDVTRHENNFKSYIWLQTPGESIRTTPNECMSDLTLCYLFLWNGWQQLATGRTYWENLHFYLSSYTGHWKALLYLQ